ncbi:MAG: class I SAM-dependent methyltransferase [Capsulimonadales bacterium]|nr:class I SAM-dependent methyltransferase [Capsulimonadales bacterium]
MRHPQLPEIEIGEDWRILEVGCGPNRLFPHSTTLDRNARFRPDILHDLNRTPFPIADDRFDLIVCLHVLEHVTHLVEATTELHRILKPGGLLFVEVPYFTSVHYHTDPTHVHAFTTRSFDYYVAGTAVSGFEYSPARFRKERVHLVVPGDGPVNRWWRNWVNSHHRIYEERLAYLLPRHVLQFTLRAEKEGG